MRWFKLNKDQRKQYDGFLKTLQGLTDADKSPNYAYIVKDPEKSILFATDGVSCAWWSIPPEIQPLLRILAASLIPGEPFWKKNLSGHLPSWASSWPSAGRMTAGHI